jgi:hypothetical protein
LGLVLGICLVFWIWCLGFYQLVPANPNRTRSALKKANCLHFRQTEIIIAADLQAIETEKFVNQCLEYSYGI